MKSILTWRSKSLGSTVRKCSWPNALPNHGESFIASMHGSYSSRFATQRNRFLLQNQFGQHFGRSSTFLHHVSRYRSALAIQVYFPEYTLVGLEPPERRTWWLKPNNFSIPYLVEAVHFRKETILCRRNMGGQTTEAIHNWKNVEFAMSGEPQVSVCKSF